MWMGRQRRRKSGKETVQNNRIANYIRFFPYSKSFRIAKWFFEWSLFLCVLFRGHIAKCMGKQQSRMRIYDPSENWNDDIDVDKIVVIVVVVAWRYCCCYFWPRFSTDESKYGWTHPHTNTNTTCKRSKQRKNYWRLVCPIVHLLHRFASVYEIKVW